MLSRRVFTAFFLTVLVAIFSGCGGSSAPAPKPKPVPKWVTSPLPADTATAMYGLGIESSRDGAIKAALSDMIAKLGTTIESNFQSTQVVTDTYSKTDVKNQIKSGVSKVKINNYQIIKSHKVSYREFAVMIQTDKQKLSSGLKENLELSKKSINDRASAIKGSDALTRYNTKKELSLDAKELLSSVLIISELDSKFNKKQNLEFISTKEKEFIAERKSLKFFVSGNNNSARFIDDIKNYLAQNGYAVASSRDGAIDIKLNTKTDINRKIGVITLNVGVFDMAKRIGGKSIILKERYNGSDASLYKNASIHLKQDIKAQGIDKTIGINLN